MADHTLSTLDLTHCPATHQQDIQMWWRGERPYRLINADSVSINNPSLNVPQRSFHET